MLSMIILSTIQRENIKHNRTCIISDILEQPFLQSYDNGKKKYSKELVMCFIEKAYINLPLCRITSDGDYETYYVLRDLSEKRLKYR